MKNVLLVVDLDGTLCDDNHRAHLAQASQWDEYHGLCTDDPPHPEIAMAIDMLSSTPDYNCHVIVITGRTEKYRQQTLDWFTKHGMEFFFDEMFMRPDDYYGKAGPMKVDYIKAYIAEHFEEEPTVFCFEDTEAVIDSIRQAGYHCWQVRS